MVVFKLSNLMDENSYLHKVHQYLQVSGVAGLRNATVSLLTPDASTRRYYRLKLTDGQSYVASVYPEAFQRAALPFLVMTDVFSEAQLPVPKVFEVHQELGVVLQEDLGDVSLSLWLTNPGRSEAETDIKIREAIALIVKIQALTDKVVAAQSLPATLAFDTEKLQWELNYFFEHFFGSLLHMCLPASESTGVQAELLQLAEWLSARPRVLTHRDFHTMNLMVDRANELRLIDYQDARMGPASYDLVPLLLERRTHPPSSEWVSSMQNYFLQVRESRGLPVVELTTFQEEFAYMTLQRELKALGTFSYQTAVMGRGDVYQPYVRPTIKLVGQYLEQLGEYPVLESIFA